MLGEETAQSGWRENCSTKVKTSDAYLKSKQLNLLPFGIFRLTWSILRRVGSYYAAASPHPRKVAAPQELPLKKKSEMCRESGRED